MKNLFLSLAFICLLATSCSENLGSGNLSKNVDGKDLTKEYCINLVRNNWDCNMGANYYATDLRDGKNWLYIQYRCVQGDQGKVINYINDFFDKGIDTEKSYYKNYILYLENKSCYECNEHIQRTLTVNF